MTNSFRPLTGIIFLNQAQEQEVVIELRIKAVSVPSRGLFF